MENASKALLMAGGILIAIIIIALLVRTFTSVGAFQKMKLSEEEQAQLVSFNEQYTKYLGQYVYGTEVITVINKSMNNKDNKITTTIKFANNGLGYTYEGYQDYWVEYNGKKVKRQKKATVTVKKGESIKIVNDEENNSTVTNFINSLKGTGDFNTMAFECTDIGYDSYGRVNSIKFEEKKWGDLY